MDLSKFTGQLPDGEFAARITKVEAGKSKAGDDKLVFYGDVPELEGFENKILFNSSLTPKGLPMLRDNLEAAEVLEEGDAYPEDPAALAEKIQYDLSDRMVKISVKPGNSGYKNVKIIGLALASV